MYLGYSIVLSLGFLLIIPLFLARRAKYAAGFRERLGNYLEFKHNGRKVIWLHCVSVGETNAARPLVDAIRKTFPDHRLVVSTTTKTGQALARSIFADKADAVVYFPFDFKFSVVRALEHFKPSLVLLMETEIWPRFIREAKRSGAKVAIVNGRISERSFKRYSKIRSFIARVFAEIDLALMQGTRDAARLIKIGMPESKTVVTGNLKFDQPADANLSGLSANFRKRFAISDDKALIVAASTHEPEERYVIEALDGILGRDCRLLIAPRHPGRFAPVERLLSTLPYNFVKRSDPPSERDREADVILLDTIGELRAVYPLAEIVFVGGSLIPHGGQSILEPAAEGRAIVTGPYTANFDEVIKEFLAKDAIRQTPTAQQDVQISERLNKEFHRLLENSEQRLKLGRNAAAIMNRGAQNPTLATIENLKPLLSKDPP